MSNVNAASRVTRARRRRSRATAGAPAARTGGCDATRAMARALARVFSIAIIATRVTCPLVHAVTACALCFFGCFGVLGGVCIGAGTVFVAGTVFTPGREGTKASPAAAASVVAARLCTLSAGLLRLKTRFAKAQVKEANATACVVSQQGQVSDAKAAPGTGASRVCSRPASRAKRCDARFGLHPCLPLAVCHARVHTVGRTLGGGPPSRRERLHPWWRLRSCFVSFRAFVRAFAPFWKSTSCFASDVTNGTPPWTAKPSSRCQRASTSHGVAPWTSHES